MLPQLEPLAGNFNELASVVCPEPSSVIKPARKYLMREVETAANHLIWHQHQFVRIDDLPLAMTPDAQHEVHPRSRPAA